MDQLFRLDAMQAGVHKRLLVVGPGPAAFYKDACRLMAGSVFPTLTHMVGHALREIESALCDVLEPLGPKRAKVTNRDDNHRGKIRTILAGLELAETDPIAQAWLRLPGRDNEYGLHKRAHRHALAPPRPLDDEFRAFFSEFTGILNAVLDRFEARYLTSHRIIDELLRERTPTEGHAKRLRNEVPNNLVSFRSFFDRLDNPAWLLPLRDAGLFSNPPAAEHDEETHMVRFPQWPQTRYLARMAALPDAAVQETVFQIAAHIDDQANASIHEDLLAIACALPPTMAAHFVPKVAQWVDSPFPLVTDRLAALIVHLEEGRQHDAAFALAEATFANPTDDADHFHAWTYNKGLTQCLPALTAAEPERALAWITSVLDRVLQRSLRTKDKQDDGSERWRPTIAEHEHQRDDDVNNILVTATRNAARGLIEQHSETLVVALALLEASGWGVATRIALHLLTGPGAPHDLVAPRLCDRRLFHSDTVAYEYRALAHEHFASLSEDEQRHLLREVDAGPPYLARARENCREWTGKEMSKEEETELIQQWQRDRLAPVQHALPHEWQERYAKLVVAVGPSADPDEYLYPVARPWGPASPKTETELASLDVTELLRFLREWQVPPTGDLFSKTPSRDGLSELLRTIVAKNPEPYAACATDFRDLDIAYVHALLMGLDAAARAPHEFPWEPVLSLLQWVLQQHDDPDDERKTRRGWAGARATCVGLLDTGLHEGPCELPVATRPVVWALLAILATDPDPTAEREQDIRDPVSLAINSTRGRALHASARYGLWVRRYVPAQPSTFADLQELRKVLEDHLEPRHDPSIAIRSFYGERFLTFCYLDRTWAAQQVPRIFPHDNDALRNAAWEAYLSFGQVYHDPATMLQGEYDRALAELQPTKSREPTPVEFQLAEHLILLYLTGHSAWADDALFTRFFPLAQEGLREHALKFAGEVAGNPHLARDWRERYERLWDKRLRAARSDPGGHQEEIAQFGWWFSNSAFDPLWALTALGDALHLVGHVEPDFQVIKRLSELAAREPRLAIDRLAELTLNAADAAAVWWSSDLRPALTGVLQSTDVDAQTAARQLIHRLAARGHLEYSDLL